MDRTILHCDCNSFFASVECTYRPELWEVPMAVCGDPEMRQGIVLAKNEQAKRYGIVTAETVWQARKKCPDLVLVPPHFDRYHDFYRRINAIYCEYTDLVEPFSIDESWLDVTGSRRLFGDGTTIADTLRRRIRNELGLTISAGVSFNKVFAKMGSDYKKPDATTVIMRDNYRDILYPLPVGSFLFVGHTAQAALARIGIRTVGDLATADRNCLIALLGKMGGTLHDAANGLDDAPVERFGTQREMKSAGNGMTFPVDLRTEEEVKRGLLYLTEPVSARLRAKKLYCRTVQLTIKYPSLKAITRQKTLPRPTHLTRELYQGVLALLRESWQVGNPIRSLTVTAGRLCEGDEGEQLCLFDASDDSGRDRSERLEMTIDELRRKYGNTSIRRCTVLYNPNGRISHEEKTRRIKNPKKWLTNVVVDDIIISVPAETGPGSSAG